MQPRPRAAEPCAGAQERPMEDQDTLEALEYELNQMGLTIDDLQPPEHGHFDRRAMTRVESAQIMSRKFMERDRVKMGMLEKNRAYRKRLQEKRTKKVQQWETKTVNSPFLVDLLAENERIDEENRVRLREEARKARLIEKRKEEAKQNIIIQALTENSDLETLRREKRAILEEEKRLKALLDIEKTAGHKKAQMLAALRAEKQRKAAKSDHRRQQFTDALQSHFDREAEVLRHKLDVPPRPGNTFTSYGS